jgi:hypothetical protein
MKLEIRSQLITAVHRLHSTHSLQLQAEIPLMSKGFTTQRFLLSISQASLKKVETQRFSSSFPSPSANVKMFS